MNIPSKHITSGGADTPTDPETISKKPDDAPKTIIPPNTLPWPKAVEAPQNMELNRLSRSRIHTPPLASILNNNRYLQLGAVDSKLEQALKKAPSVKTESQKEFDQLKKEAQDLLIQRDTLITQALQSFDERITDMRTILKDMPAEQRVQHPALPQIKNAVHQSQCLINNQQNVHRLLFKVFDIKPLSNIINGIEVKLYPKLEIPKVTLPPI